MRKLVGMEQKLKNYAKTIVDDVLGKIIKKEDKSFNDPKKVLKDVIKKPDLFDTFKSLQKGMNDYEQSSQKDETINILNDCIIDRLFDLLCQALKNSKIGEFIAKGSNALLREMESTKKNLRSELKNIGALPESSNSTLLNSSQMKCKDNSKNKSSRIKNVFKKIKDAFRQIISIIENVINNKFKNNFKYPEGTNTIIYINLKFGGNPLKKILFKELEISLYKLKDIIQNLSVFIKNIINALKGEDNPIVSFKNFYDEFSNNSLVKIREGLSESIQNIRIGLLSLIFH